MKKLFAVVTCIMLMSGIALAEQTNVEFPLTDEKITLTFWSNVDSNVSEFETNEAVIAYEEKTNVHIEWISASSSDATTQLSLSLASGDYPDAYLMAFNNTYQTYTYGSAGVLIPLNDLIDEYAPNAKRILENNPELREQITAPDGNIYTLFRCWEDPTETIFNKMFVNVLWLEEAGLEMPTTLDEFRAMLEYFRDHDMNGNGDTTDEIPLMGTYQYRASGSDPIYYIMEAFQLFPGNNFMIADEEGNITYQANTQAFRDGLTYCYELVRDGLLSEETYVQDLTQYRSIVNVTDKSESIVGTAAAPYYMRFITQSIYEDAFQDYKAIPPLANYYDGETRQTTQSRNFIAQPLAAITSACEHPEIVIQWLDYWLSEEGTMSTVKYGVEGTDWVWTDEYPGLDGSYPSILLLATSENVGANRMLSHHKVPTYISYDLFLKTSTDPDNTSDVYPNYEAHLAYADYAVPQGIPYIVWCADEEVAAEFSELKSQIESYVVTSYTEFVLGYQDITDDDVWNAYLQGLDDLGLERYLEVAEAYYFGE